MFAGMQQGRSGDESGVSTALRGGSVVANAKMAEGAGTENSAVVARK